MPPRADAADGLQVHFGMNADVVKDCRTATLILAGVATKVLAGGEESKAA